ncbi:MAG: toxin-antitoxin system YwqK family antitoxin [Leptonema sp. (in: bacteria)]
MEVPPKPKSVLEGAVYKKKFKIWEYRSEHKELVWNQDGKLLREANLKNNLYDGEYLQFFENGRISEKGFYEEGYRLGKWYFYYPNGNLYLELEYKKEPVDVTLFRYNSSIGNENGQYKRYYPNGVLEEEGYYYAGKLHKKRIRYYLDKKIHFIGYYSYGKKENRWQYYFNSKLIREEFYKEDNLIKILRY